MGAERVMPSPTKGIEPYPLEMRDVQEDSASRTGSPLSEETEDGGEDTAGSEDEDDQDEVRSLIGPSMSHAALWLASPSTPAADKAAAMEKTRTAGAQSHQKNRLPSPWQPGAQMQVLSSEGTSWTFGHSRQPRAMSVGENALKRLSKALPTISLPTGLFGTSNQSPTSQSPSGRSPDKNESPRRHLRETGPREAAFSPGIIRTAADTERRRMPSPETPGMPQSRNSRSSLRRSNSDESLLYLSLSRVSSFGNDERWINVREQVNSRLKALMDSLEGPSFKLPQFQNMLPAPLKRSILAGTTDAPSSVSLAAPQTHPLDRVLADLEGDVVILGGYRGSTLRSAQPPHRQLWAPIKAGLNLRKVDLELGLDVEDEERAEERIFSSGILQNIGPVDIAKRLIKKMQDCENVKQGTLRLHDYGYDWRLSPHLLSQKLINFLETLPCNQPGVDKTKRGAFVIAHSLGGLITRHAVNQRPELFAGVVFAGTPQRCVNILGPLRNGDSVLLSDSILTARVNFSIRTTFVFLPEDGACFINRDTGEEYPVDFYSVDDWIRYRWSPCVGLPPLPASGGSSNSSHSNSTSNNSSSPNTNNNPITSLSSLLNKPNGPTFPSLPLRGRSSSDAAARRGPGEPHLKDATIAPQMGANPSPPPPARSSTDPAATTPDGRSLAYLARTLADTRRFRAQLAHLPAHQAANRYPPLAVVYGKDTPTVHAAHVASREAIARADAYDELVFRSGDGVALAREAMLPPGYALVHRGRVSTRRGHVTMLGDVTAVGKALEAVVRGRRKGIGLGVGDGNGCGKGLAVGTVADAVGDSR